MNVAQLTDLGRTRLSRHFFMREMLYSEVANAYGLPNFPEDPDLAVEAGRHLCEELLEPLHDRFGHVSIRSAYRSPTVNGFCAQRYASGETACWCLDNDANAAHHIWDRRDEDGHLGATATVFLPSYLESYQTSRDYRPLAWWIRDNLPGHADIYFFPDLCAFNIRWYAGETDQAIWHLDPPRRELLTRRGEADFEGDHSPLYATAVQG